MDIDNEYFKKWEKTYYKLHYYSYEQFLRNLCNDEYDGLFTEEEGTGLLKRFQQYKKMKINEIVYMLFLDDAVLQVARSGCLC